MTLSEGERRVPEDRTGGGRDTVTFFLPYFYHGRARERASGVKNAKVRSGH